MINLSRISAPQRATLEQRKAQGFTVIEVTDAIRVTRHGDSRIILPDGSEKRAHHQVVPARPRGRA
jgi:hypothetical protein